MTEGKTLAELGVQVGDVVELVHNGILYGAGVGKRGTVDIRDGQLVTTGGMNRADDCGHLFRLIYRAQPARVERYDLDYIGFNRSDSFCVQAFSWKRSPEGWEWWVNNHESTEGLARLEQMRAQWDAEHAPKTPVREVVKTRKEILPGVYVDVEVSEHGEVRVAWMDGEAQLTAAIATLTLIRDAMEDGQ